MSKWVRFSRTFNFVPKRKASVTIQHVEGDIDDVTAEHAAKAIEKGAAVEIVAPKNADEAARLRSGELQWVEVKAKDETPATPSAPAATPAAKS